MLKIRLKQTGKRDDKKYRIIVIESTHKRDGKEIEIIGHYDPITNPSTIKINLESADSWIQKGAQMTVRVAKMYNLAKENKIK